MPNSDEAHVRPWPEDRYRMRRVDQHLNADTETAVTNATIYSDVVLDCPAVSVGLADGGSVASDVVLAVADPVISDVAFADDVSVATDVAFDDVDVVDQRVARDPDDLICGDPLRETNA